MRSLNESNISFLVRRSFDLAKFNALIDVAKEQVNISGNILADESLEILQETSHRILASLSELRHVIEKIDNIGRKIEYEIKWIFQGRIELASIFSSIDVLEYIINSLLSKFDKISNLKTESLIDSIDSICNMSLEIKKLISPYKKRLAIANHHNEIEKEVLASVKNEILFCVEKLEELNEKKQLINIQTEIKDWTLEDFKLRVKKLDVELSSKYNGLILVSNVDAEIFDEYTTLYETILPISQSLKLIPRTLEDFYHNARLYYQYLVLDNIKEYEEIMASYESYRQGLRAFRNDYITARISFICEKVFEEASISKEKSNSLLESVLDILKPIENFYGLSENHSSTLKTMEDKLYNVSLEENIHTPPPKNRKLGTKRVFSNPIVDSLNMKPILSENRVKKRPEFKIFQTPRNIDDDCHMKANMEILERIKADIGYTSTIKIQQVPNTPLVLNSPQSSESSPDTMQTRNIFDSPDPFITPNSRSFQKSRLPISTPLTTPRITPTKSFTAFPPAEALGQKNESLLKSNTRAPLLRMELSTIINIESEKKNKDNNSVVEASNALSKLSLTPTQIPTMSKQKFCQESPPAELSRIPLPKRPESRLNMLRSVSRLQTDRIRTDRNHNQVEFGRSDSRLENIASSISMKFGTDSPICASERKARPATVMTQREIKPRSRAFQQGRLMENSATELLNIKTRGATSLGARTLTTSSRISSI